ncbi:hypothetical protein SEVIR_4G222500v4 [Setaria viridis]
METLMVDRVHSSLRLFMHRNAVFLCERLCAQFPSETNVQLLATCYLHNNQPYAAYHILKGKKLPESRYLFAMSCFRMNLLREAEDTLCPVNETNETNIEVPSGATGHYLLGVIYRCTGRMSAAAEQFTQALTLDPLLWAAYEELCILGVAEDADGCFSEATALRLQQEHTSTSTLEKSNFANENRILSSSLPSSLGDIIPKQMKQLHANNTAEVPGYPHVRATALHVQNSTTSNVAQFDTPSPIATQTSSIVPPPLFRNVHAFQISGDVPAKQKANGANQPLRRKHLDEAKLKKVSGRLFNQSSDSLPRRSARLSRDATINSNSNISQFGGNGPDHSSGKLRVNSSTPSKLCSTAVRSVQVRKGKPRATENFDEGSRYEVIDEMWTDNMPATSSSVSTTDGRFFEQDKTERIMSQDSKVAVGIRELLGLLRTLGEGFRLSCLFKCQV